MKRAPTKAIPIERAFEVFYADSTSPSGLRNAVKRGRRPDGAKDHPSGWSQVNKRNGYTVWMVYIDGKTYPAHRVVYAMRTGNPNPVEVDHKDRNAQNNHPFNLREADRSEQCINRSHWNAINRYPGVFCRNGRTWTFEIRRRSQGARIVQGGFATEYEAHLARRAALARLNTSL